MNSNKLNPNTSVTSSSTPEANTEKHSSNNPNELDPIAAMYGALNLMMSRDKCVVPDTPGVYAPYPSFDACVTKVAALIDGTGIGYYQYVQTEPEYIAVETILTHSGGEELATGAVIIPLAKKEASGVANALGWAKRLSLVHAFSLGTKELPPEEQQEIQNQKPAKSESKTLSKIEL